MKKLPGQELRRVMLAAVLLALLLTGCSGAKVRGKDEVLTILASSELRDLEPLLPEMEAVVKVPIRVEYAASLDVVDQLVKGKQVDLAWPAQGAYLALFPDAKSPAVAQEKIMLSPVVVGVKESLAQEWGWANNPNLTWRDVAERSAAGELRFAMTSPSGSQAGLSALMGVSAALMGRPDPLQESDLASLKGSLGSFLSGQTLAADASKLADRYLKQQDSLDGIIDYEASLLALNQNEKLVEKLVLVYPREGIVTADYPLVLVDSDWRPEYTRLVNFLRSPEIQQKIMNLTYRRPANPEVALSDLFPRRMLVELPYPNRLAALTALRASQKGPAGVIGPAPTLSSTAHVRHLILVVDVSASMRGARLEELKQALAGSLNGLGSGVVRLTIVAYNHAISAQSSFDVDLAKPETLQEVRGFISVLQASGGTASYSALRAAYETAQRARKLEPELPTRVVLVTDGSSTQGLSDADFVKFYRSARDLSDVPTLVVVTGEGDMNEFDTLVKATGGSAVSASGTDLARVLLEQVE